MNLIPTLFVALSAAALGSAAAANNTGSLPATAEVAAPAGFDELVIRGQFTDGTGSQGLNLVDLFQINITNAGHYFFNTFGSEVADTQLFLFDSTGKGLVWNNDATLTPVNTLSALDAQLEAGTYYLAVSWIGMVPLDGSMTSIFDTLGNGGGPLGGSGALASWADFSGAGQFDSKFYFINGYVSVVPEPAALGLMLAGLALIGRAATRRRTADAATDKR
jgi:hypothetical protein